MPIDIKNLVNSVSPIGFTGSQGGLGFTGSVGFTGSQGVGFTGSRGNVGFTGSQGSQGVTGFTGSQGSQGATGFTGSAGAGFTGSQGVTGFTGSSPITGFTNGADNRVLTSTSATAINAESNLTFDGTTLGLTGIFQTDRYNLTISALGTGSGNRTIDLNNGNYFTATANGATTWTFSNAAASRAVGFVLELTNGGSATQQWPNSVDWPGGVAPTLTASGVDVLTFITDDGGTIWRGVASMLDSK